MEAQLRELSQADGRPYELIALPTPNLVDSSGSPLPASYVNFLVSNGQVLVPQYGIADDRVAMRRLASAFPEHQTLGIDCHSMVRHGGGLHCATLPLGIACSPPI